jgi:hypothetical protein
MSIEPSLKTSGSDEVSRISIALEELGIEPLDVIDGTTGLPK